MTKTHLITVGILTLFLAPLPNCGNALASEGTVVFRNVNVVAMTSEEIQQGRDVVVSRGRIVSIRETGAVLPAGARVIDGRGKYLLPGLMDMHVHMDDDKCAPLYLAYGITRVRNMSAHKDQYERKRRLASGAMTGPVMYTSGPALLSTYPPYEFNVTTEEQARQGVRAAKAAGADWIKIMRIDANLFADILDEAHKLNLPVGGHLPSLSTPILEIYRSGLRSHEHVAEVFTSESFFNLVPDETKLAAVAQQIKETGITISTIIHRETIWWRMRQEGDAYLSAERLAEIQKLTGPTGVDEARQFLEGLKTETPQVRERTVRIHSNIPFILKIVKALHDAGVRLVIGTDSHFYFSVAGESLHDELDLLREAGLTPYQALRIATVNGAALLNASDRLGTVEPGKIADLVLVNGNPLASLKTLRAPAGVMVEGRWFDRDALDGLRQSGTYTEEEAAVMRAAMARNKEIFAAYVDALNRHDVDAQYAFYAPEMTYVDEGRRTPPNKEGERRSREFEAANHAVWSYEVSNVAPDSLELQLTEEMDFYQILGVGKRSHNARFRFRDGKIIEARSWNWTQTGQPYRETVASFMDWLRQERPQEAARVTDGERLQFTASAAPGMNRLIREWRKSHPVPTEGAGAGSKPESR